jgi:RNA polymerase sigma factor (sigma-70 family)
MGQGQLDRAVHHLRALVEDADADRLTDRQLLERFARLGDEAAFAHLVRRHGALVLGVARDVLRNPHDADDVFQATWLVLARRARAVRWQESVGGWLCEVAHRLALRARAQSARRRNREAPLTDEHAAPAVGDDRAELRAVLRAEVGRLPEKYRSPLVLCDLEGKTNAEAARALGRPPGSMSRLLARARELLRERLTRDGFPLTLAALTAALASTASAAVSEPLIRSCAHAAGLFAGGASLTDVASAPAAVLVQGALREMTRTHLKLIAVLCLTFGVIGTAAAVVHFRPPTGKPDVVKPAPKIDPTKGRRLASTQWLSVYQIIDGQAVPKLLGYTGGFTKTAVVIPANANWYVQPMAGGLVGGIGGVAGGIGGVAGVGGIGAGVAGAKGAIGGIGAGAAGIGGGVAGVKGVGGVGGATGFTGAGGVGGIGRVGGMGVISGGPGVIGGDPGLLNSLRKLTGKDLKALVAEMKKQSIPGLCIDNFEFTNDDLAELKELSDLKILLLRNNKVDDDGLKHVLSLKALKMLGLEKTGVTEKGLEKLKELKSLTTIRLEGDKFTDKAAADLKQVPTLTTLRLSNTKIGAKGLKELGGLSDLETLELLGGFTDDDLPPLKNIGKLKVLRLHQAKITDKGVETLKEIGTLRTLALDVVSDWTGNPLLMPTWDASGVPTKITLGMDWRVGLATYDPVTRKLVKNDDKPKEPRGIGADGLKQLKGLKLTELSVVSDRLNAAALEPLKDLTGLKRLTLWGGGVTDKGLASIKGLKQLETLDLRGTLVTPDGFASLRVLPNLKTLWTNLASLDLRFKGKLDAVKRALPKVRVHGYHDGITFGFGMGGIGGIGGPGPRKP